MMMAMSDLSKQLPHTMAFPNALGTGLVIQSALDANAPIAMPPLLRGTGITGSISLYDAIDVFIDEYETALSRFRTSSLVTRMRQAKYGGTFDFPDWCGPLFDLYDRLFDATDGAIDPCVGEDLIRLGYDATYSFTVEPDAFCLSDARNSGGDGTTGGNADGDIHGKNHTDYNTDMGSRNRYPQPDGHLGAIHGRPTWHDDVERHGTTLIAHRAVALDFGACGKGYLVDLIAGMLEAAHTAPQPVQYVIDAGGDLMIHTNTPITIAMEDPADPTRAVGTVELCSGALCASAPSRRRWGEAAGHQLHHLLNAIDGLPVDEVAATWVAVQTKSETTIATSPNSQRQQEHPGTNRHPAPGTAHSARSVHPTALADALATALFTTPANQLRAHFAFDCAILNADRTAAQSAGFPGGFFTR